MMEKKMQQQTEQTVSLMQEALRLRKEARGTPPGIERERLVRRARQYEAVAKAQWIKSPERAPTKG